MNPKDQAYERYGGRGIQFRFKSPLAMAMWVEANLGLHPELQLDRIDNEGHYEAGNLRYATRSLNQSNQRGGRWTAKMHKFRLLYPGVRYADSTIVNLIHRGLSYDEIAARFQKPSFKPKGVYGTFSTPDPAIASLSKDC
jgi:hypothetical protein